jgi:hypothetical protein
MEIAQFFRKGHDGVEQGRTARDIGGDPGRKDKGTEDSQFIDGV